MASIPEINSVPQSQTLDLSRFTDQQLISFLRRYGSVNAALELEVDLLDDIALTRMESPDKLPTFFLMRQASAPMEGWKTDHGNWLPKKLVSIPFQGNSPNSPKFVGAKATLELKPTGAKKAVVGMVQYHVLATREDGCGFYLNEDLVLCHVYPLEEKDKVNLNGNGKRPRSGYAADQFKDFAPPKLNESEQVMYEFDFKNMHPLDVTEYPVDVPRLESKHWHSFTKIYTKNSKLMYAACNHCNTMLKLKGGTSCGTGSLKRHNDTCRCKPKQEQLPGNTSSMPIPSIALEGHQGITRDSVVDNFCDI